MEQNGFTPTNEPDQTSTQPVDSTSSTTPFIPTNKPENTSVTIQKGDTLSGIAQKEGVSVNDISGYKSGDPDKIQVGETVNIPRSAGEISDKSATKGAFLSGADPTDLQWAKKELGKKEFQGWCQAFVSKATQSGWQGSSAYDAWQRNQHKVEASLSGIQPGDLIYFSPNSSNGGYGHVGIYEAGDKFISATDNGVAEYNFKNWNKITGQKILGYIPQGKVKT